MAACEVRCTDHEDAASLEAAADRIERLERENAALRVQLEDMTDRLDWLATSSMWLDVPGTESFTPETLRAAIDAARKEGGAT
jgi:hypothetical protein